MRVVRRWAGAVVRRTEHAFLAFAALIAVLGACTGASGWAALDHRQDRVADAADRRAELTAKALDVYRAMADADAHSLNAVLVDAERSTPLRTRFLEDVSAATEALHLASARSADTGDRTAEQVRELAGLLPPYTQLVVVGWTESDAGHPVGTSYLSNASSMVRTEILPRAKRLHDEQSEAVVQALRDAGAVPWPPLVTGVAMLVALVAAQRFVTRRTRRRVNPGLVLATALTSAALLGAGAVVGVVAARGDVGERELAVVGSLAEVRNRGRNADEAEARILIFPKAGDVRALAEMFTDMEERVVAAGGDEVALGALRAWRAHDQPLLATARGDAKPPGFTELARMITAPAPGGEQTLGQQLDARLTELVERHRAVATDSTGSAKATLANWDAAVAALIAAAVVSALLGLGVRIREYYT
ncbi:hypothetical protein [Saccharothrix syringae]|uniref:hypothetical protein n=1 Tax=Saccharothrix syringae TaxID=103733 RepID=UPI0005266ED7|nr:hypothetical protein [Saccharothrix syringae]